jgi:hypothetical protein
MDYKYNIFFNIEERNNGRSKVLIDTEGFICGVFSTYKAAKDAMPRIRKNLIKHFRERDAAKEFDSGQASDTSGSPVTQ